jgi:Uma2 family endonuclease
MKGKTTMVATSTPPIPFLENGDRLSRHEFERRYNARLHLRKAERIEGVVYVAAALRFKSHAKPHGDLIGWLWNYKIATQGVELGDNPTIRLDIDNDPQPDAVLLIEEYIGGQSHLSDDDYIEGAPELIVEIAASSASIDLHDKKQVYQRNGVREYIVWQVFEKKIDWFVLKNGEYSSLSMDVQGVIRSEIFPGLWLAVSDLLSGDMVQVLAILQDGLKSQEHAKFVQKLSQHRKGV